MFRRGILAGCCLVLATCGSPPSPPGPYTPPPPLEVAARNGDLAEVRRLLSLGANPNDQTSFFAPPLASAALKPRNVEVIRTLLAAGANPSGRPAEGNRCWATPLTQAAWSGDLENAKALLDAGASLAPGPCSRFVPGALKPPMTDFLRSRGLDIFRVDEYGRNALHEILAPSGIPPVEGIDYLIRAGVPLNARDKSGKTPLAYWREPRAIETQRLKIVLLELLTDDNDFEQERARRDQITALLQRAGAH